MREGWPSFAAAYDEHVGHVFGFFAYRGCALHDAEDLTQVTFERALAAWGRFDARRAQPRTWLLAIARNVLIDHWRADGRDRREPLDESHAVGAVPGPEPGGLEPTVERALAALSPREREVVALRFGGDLSGPEVATVTDSSLASVQQAVARALRRLRSELGAPLAAPTEP